MKQKFKRLMAGLLAIVTAFTAMFSNGITAEAASSSANISFYYASVKDTGVISELKAGYDHGKVLYAIIDGHVAYCMNFGLAADGGQLMNSYDNPSTDLTTAQEKLLAYCLYFGYGSTSSSAPSNDQCDQYIATQAMVWVIVGNLFGTSSGDSAAKKLCNSAPDADSSYSYYTKLKTNISNSYYAKRPSFASSTKSSAETYVLKWSEENQRFETTLTDENGVLSNFDISLSGYTVEKSGNKVTIHTTSVNTTATTATMKSTAGVVETTSSCVFWLTDKSGYQEFVSEKPTADPISAYFKVKTENIGYGKIIKEDEESGAKLPNATYGIYKDSSCTNLVDTITTGSDGTATSKALVAGTYYVKEITAPSGYVLSSKVHTVTVKAGQTTTFTATDKEQKGALVIYKEGEVLTGWDGSDFTYEVRKLPGATFKVTAGANIYKADGTKVYSKGDVIAENLVTGSDGKVTLTDLYLGDYVVTETASIDGYTINSTPVPVSIEYEDQTVNVQYESTTVKNNRQKAEVTVVKKDSDTENALDGGEYTIYAGNDIVSYDGKVIVSKGTALETVTTGENGKATFTIDLPIANSYYVSETKAPYGYLRNSDDTYSFTFNYLLETSATAKFSHTFYNDRTTAKIHIYKLDKETGLPVPQGDASLEGAVYGLYARDDITHPDGTTGVVFEADDLVATLTTDENGEAEIDNLYLGNYYVKEITAPEGYLLDEEEHDLVCNYEGDLVAEVSRSTTTKEQVYKQPFQLIKVSDDGDETEADLLANAGFTVYLKSSLSVNEDGSYDYDSATPVVIGENGETELFTDDEGYLVTIALPYGTYVVVESTTPHNMETIKPFEVKISENNPNEPQIWRVFIDREFTAKLRIVKKDSDTGKTVLVPNTEFRIYNLDTDSYVEMVTTYPSKVIHTTFFTDDDGDLILPDTLGIGNYRIEEVAAPYGYVLNENYVEIQVDTNTFYEVDPDTYEAIITVEYEDMPAVGELVIEKKGELLEDYEGSLFASSEDKEFVYEEGSLAGATFEIYAAEDIYTADMQTLSNGERTKYYSEGDLVATVVTGEDGTATVTDLPLGKYKVVEVEAPYGYVLNTEEQYVTFVYVDDKTPVIYESLTFSDERQKVDLSVIKLDGETEKAIAGAVFGLYASEDIENADGDVIVKKDTLLETAVSDENGKIAFTKDYPLSKYYAKEITAPDGYASCDDIIIFNATYTGQEYEYVSISKYFLNYPTTFEFSKVDITSGEELSGATLSVIDKDGNVIETWTSKKGETHTIKKLLVGETYVLREEYAPYGYLQATDVEFTVMDTDEIQSVVMKDEVPTGTIIINKDGEFLTDINLVKGHWYDFIFDYFKDSLAGVTFEVYAAEDILSVDGLDSIYYEKDELVAEIVTNDDGIAMIENLPLGKYYIIETKTLEGYVLDDTSIEVELSYVDQNTSIVYAGMGVTNERQKVEITVIKKDAYTNETLEGAIFGLYAKEDIKDAEGNVLVEADTLIEKAVTGTDGMVTFISDLPLGNYYLKEIQAPAGYVKSDECFDIDATYQGDDIEVIEIEAVFTNYPTKLEISKTDITGDNELPGATLSIIDEAGNVIASWVSDEETHVIERIPVGKYILREETSPYGYTISNNVEFEVTETKEIQKVVMKDDYLNGKIIIYKTDSNTGKGIAGVTFEIRDAEGNVIETLVTDKNGYAESTELPIGTYKNGKYEEDIKYYVVETKAASGYTLDDTAHEVVFKYEGDAPEIVTYALNIANKPTKPNGPKTGDDFNPWILGTLGISVLGIGVIAVIKRKRNKETETE